MKPITSRDPRDLVAKVEVTHGQQTADALAAAMLPSLRADAAEIDTRLGELVTEYPALKSVRRTRP